MQMDELIAGAFADPARETDLLNRLLETTLYVHAPKISTGERLSVVKFKTPQGILAIPVFTDRKKAKFASSENVRIVSVQGRRLLSAIPGETVVINPNDIWCILYPEETQALLRGQSLGKLPKSITLSHSLELRRAKNLDATFLDRVVSSLASVESALDAWLMEADDEESISMCKYVVVVAAEAPHRDRIARSLALALFHPSNALDMAVDVTFIEPGEASDKWVARNSDCLIYRRSWLPGIRSAVHGNS